MVVDVFRAIIGMKSLDDEGEAFEQRFEHRDQERLADALAGSHPLVLGHAIHGIDAIDAFDAVLIALMHAVHAQVAGLVVGGRSASFTDGDSHRSRLGPDLAVPLITGAAAQVIQVRYRDYRQALVAGIVKDAIGALHELLGGQARQDDISDIRVLT